ncbi:MAG: reverse transcriptase domain-containing protein [Hyphomonas sp.]
MTGQLIAKKTGVLTDPVSIILTSLLLFQRPKGSSVSRLAIGAPSSPFLSNALMFEFDKVISEAVARDHVVYTRYADDLTFSAPRTGHLVNVEKIVRSTLRSLEYPKLTINEDKTTRITRKYGRKVTGLTLTNDGKVSIGHHRKRLISATVHHASLGKLNNAALGELKGLLGFANSAEPEFIQTLKDKYGAELIHFIQTYPNSKRER